MCLPYRIIIKMKDDFQSTIPNDFFECSKDGESEREKEKNRSRGIYHK